MKTLIDNEAGLIYRSYPRGAETFTLPARPQKEFARVTGIYPALGGTDNSPMTVTVGTLSLVSRLGASQPIYTTDWYQCP